MLKRMVIMLVAVAVVFAAIFGFQAFKAKMIAQAIANLRNPPQSVSTMTAATQPWQDQLEAVGSTRAEKGADLSSQVSGIVRAIHFQSGARVEQGTLLVELDASDDVAKLDALKATAKLAQLNYDRDNRLLKTDAVSQQAVDTDLANLQNNQAQVAQQQALVDFKSVKAPFAGRLGIRMIDLGQYIAAGTPMVTLQHLDPIYVDFYLPQQALAKIKVGQQVTAKIDTWPGASFAGEISAINPVVSASTRNVQVRATLKNPDEKMLPGMFATIDIDLGAPKDYVTVPKTAISYNSYGNIAYVIELKSEGKGVAHQTFVKTGPTRGDQVAVLDGVKPGDIVATAGQTKLNDGSPVIINNEVTPPFSANPQVSEE